MSRILEQTALNIYLFAMFSSVSLPYTLYILLEILIKLEFETKKERSANVRSYNKYDYVLLSMPKLSCSDYGFECDFDVDDKDVQVVVEKFGKHTSTEHGIEYTKEVLMQFIVRQKRPWVEAEVYP